MQKRTNPCIPAVLSDPMKIKVRVLSMIRLLKTFPSTMRSGWNRLLHFYLPAILLITILTPAILEVLSIFMKFRPHSESIFQFLWTTMLMSFCFVGIFIAAIEILTFVVFYFWETIKILCGSEWTSRDLRQFRLEANIYQPMWPSWVYWQQLRFHVWWVDFRDSVLEVIRNG